MPYFYPPAVFFPEVGGSTLDSHHGFVVEYGKDRDVDLGKWLILGLHLYLSRFIFFGFLSSGKPFLLLVSVHFFT